MHKTTTMGKDIEFFIFLFSIVTLIPFEEEIELLLVLNTKDFIDGDVVNTIENIGKETFNEFSIIRFRNLRLLS